MKSKADLLAAGYKGYAGWGEAEALADFRATGGAGKYDPSSLGGGGGGGGSAPSYTDIARQQLELQKEANRPAIETLAKSKAGISSAFQAQQQALEGYRSPLSERYDALISEILGKQTQAVSQEFGRRGIPLSSGMYDEAVIERNQPVQRSLGAEKTMALMDLEKLISDVGVTGAGQLSAIDSAIAQLQSGSASAGLAQALQQYQFQQSQSLAERQQALAEQIAKQTSRQTQTVTVGGRLKLIDSQTGAVIADLGPTSAGGSPGLSADVIKILTGGATTPVPQTPLPQLQNFYNQIYGGK